MFAQDQSILQSTDGLHGFVSSPRITFSTETFSKCCKYGVGLKGEPSRNKEILN